MALLSNCACTETLALVLCVGIGIFAYFKWAFGYWKRKGVPYLKPSIPMGNMECPIIPKRSFAESVREWYSEAKRRGDKHVGLFIFSKPVYMPIDLELVRNVLVKDFDHFVDRGVFFNERDVLSLQLFSLEGSRWRNLRAKLTPTFSSGKLKTMFGMVAACGRQMVKAMEDKGGPIDIKDWAGRYGTDVIGTCAFGIECNSFQNPNSDFRRFSKRALLPTAWNSFKIFLAFTSKNLGRMLDIRITPDDVSGFFTKIVQDTIKYREENKVVRSDFLQILLDLRNATDESGHHLTVEEIVAQSFLFFLAGFETMSTAMTSACTN
ncbi:hypothetical protein PPYR_03637 [Photinus pyralis]|uniref:Cytochrome P450 n=1 Tax=Photinus pyralis TaxID=7054 RepID=A0A5N4A3E5_PHOPY|nr:hypothetical protein PPYR_03637 [Photinus pyralis]